jgi:hypothetical protein
MFLKWNLIWCLWGKEESYRYSFAVHLISSILLYLHLCCVSGRAATESGAGSVGGSVGVGGGDDRWDVGWCNICLYIEHIYILADIYITDFIRMYIISDRLIFMLSIPFILWFSSSKFLILVWFLYDYMVLFLHLRVIYNVSSVCLGFFRYVFVSATFQAGVNLFGVGTPDLRKFYGLWRMAGLWWVMVV